MVFLDVPEGYDKLWRKVLACMAHLAAGGRRCDYFMHADDDSFVRLDLLLPLLVGVCLSELVQCHPLLLGLVCAGGPRPVRARSSDLPSRARASSGLPTAAPSLPPLCRCSQDASPRQRFYWGYIWDGTGNRVTAPIRNPLNKSYMPEEDYPLDHYPPFASGCGFVLSWDLVTALLAQPLPDYRLLVGGRDGGRAPAAAGGAGCGAHARRRLPGHLSCHHSHGLGSPVAHARTWLAGVGWRAGPSVWHPLVWRRAVPAHAAGRARARRPGAALPGHPPVSPGHHRAALPAAGGDASAVPAGGRGGGGVQLAPRTHAQQNASAALQARSPPRADEGCASGAPAELYQQLVSLGLLRR
jgi:hypothetical protein